jgi:hypothetical protein
LVLVHQRRSGKPVVKSMLVLLLLPPSGSRLMLKASVGTAVKSLVLARVMLV